MTQTDTQSPAVPRMIFATRTLQQLPFKLGGVQFTSKRLTAEEDLVYENAKLRGAFLPLHDQITETVATLTTLLRRRADTELENDWAAHHLNATTETALMAYLRTGHNGPGLVPAPGTTFDLPHIELEIDGQQFAGTVMSYAEAREFSRALPMEAAERAAELERQNLTVSETRRQALDMVQELTKGKYDVADRLADVLGRRQQDAEGRELITGAWLLERLSQSELEQLQRFLQTGQMETEAPNAPTPANLPISG